MAGHRNRGQPVTALADQMPEAGPFGAEHQCRRQREIHVGIRGASLRGEADRPDAGVFQLLEGPRDVHHVGHADVRRRASRRLGRRPTQARCMAGLPDDPGTAGRRQRRTTQQTTAQQKTATKGRG